MMAIGVDNEQDRLMFKRIFILYIQMAFLLPTTINKISHVHLAPIFEMETITKQNWGGHILSFIIKGITDYKLKKKKAIDGCLFALKIRRGQKDLQNPGLQTGTETTDSNNSTSESESEEDSEDSPRKQPSQKAKKMESKKRKKNQEDSDSESESTDESEESSPVEKQKTKKKTQRTPKKSEIGTEYLDEFLRKNNEKSTAEGEKEADLRSTKGHYVSSETIPDVNLGSDDPSSQGHTEQSSVNKPAESMLSLVEESASEPVEENMMVVREETPSEGLAIVPIQVCLPLSQTTTVLKIEETPETENEPTPVLQIEGTTKSNPAPEDAAALMMMARTTSYVPKTDLMPSFSLGLTDSSQEAAATQEGASTQDGGRAKTPETPKLLEQLGDLVQKIASGGVTTKEKSPQIPKESDAESFEKFETPARTNQHSSDMKEKCYLWAIRIVSAMCFILNQQKIKRFQEEVYCLPPDIVNMALGNHPQGVFLQSKNNKPFRVEDYPMFIPFLDLKKLATHRYGYVILRIKVYAGGTSEIKGQRQGNCTTIPSHLGPKDKHEVDHFRVEYASQILFHDMNLDKAEAIRGSNAIRLSKPSSLLLSPYCQIDSKDIDTD
ncbi:hypothetical protein Ahy_B10g105664 [Arachis hypogaea]|uniref:Uncharacterized protein n=1 Tax=Arachis hypogaea TaxID=3818 RepID=A0A444X8L8_ARAHY|nr:hypothetical protein Ahy_B10g105664 [Arachis hypogaea]